jgi:hypothetical protein
MLGVAALALAFALAVSRALRPGPANARAAAIPLRFDSSLDDSASGVADASADASASAIARTIADGIVRDAGRAGGTTWPVVAAHLRAVPSADVRATWRGIRRGLSVQWQDSVHLRAVALDAGAAVSPAVGPSSRRPPVRRVRRIGSRCRCATPVGYSIPSTAALRCCGRAASLQTPLRGPAAMADVSRPRGWRRRSP